VAVAMGVAAPTMHAQARRSTPAQAPTVSAAASASPARELVSKYCLACHNQRVKSGNLMLDQADAAAVSKSAETWEKVVVKLRTRTMPPAGRPRPDARAYDAAAAWLEGELDRAAAAHPNPGRPAALHRLNRTEYANAVHDLLAVPIDGTAMLPPDEQAHGFDTNADALAVTPALLDRYLSAATTIARLAVGDPTIPAAFVRYTAVSNNANERTWLWQTERLGEEFPLGSRGGVAAHHYFPVEGEYVLRVRLDRTWEGLIRGLNVPNQIEVRVDGVRVAQFTVGGGPSVSLLTADDELEVRVPLKAGLRQVVATVVKSDSVKAEGLGPARFPIWSLQSHYASSQLMISALHIGGPYNGHVPRESPSRRRIFVCHPVRPTEVSACATTILSGLARRAYRRPVTRHDVQTLLGFFEQGHAAGGFDAGIRAVIERLLVSPDFLFRLEMTPAALAPGAVYRLSDVELASRLSFFLWSSLPDDELLDLAIAGQLTNPLVLDRQVRRMLRAPRARRALVDNFFGQWLQIRNVWLLTPDVNRHYPWFDDNLRTALVTEMEMFLDAQLQEDRSVTELLTAKDTFLNERLARHYGVSGVHGSHFRRVALTDESRWGLLGKGSVLAVTSYPHRTSPTIRGKWLLENILAAPVPPPPPNVSANLDADTAVKTTSVRQMLEAHRKNPVCASCHARMDPLGFSLENFDSLGQWRTVEAGAPINASGELLDGSTVDGPAALRRALVAQQDQFVKAVAGKLLMYAIGRPVEYDDAPAIRAIVRAAAADHYQWSSVITAMVKSAPFQMRRAGS